MKLEKTKYEDIFFGLTLNEAFYHTLHFRYFIGAEVEDNIWMKLDEATSLFKKEIIENNTPDINMGYLLRIKKQVSNIYCELTEDEKKIKLEESLIWDEEMDNYDFHAQSELIGIYEFVAKLKIDILDSINLLIKTKQDELLIYSEYYDSPKSISISSVNDSYSNPQPIITVETINKLWGVIGQSVDKNFAIWKSRFYSSPTPLDKPILLERTCKQNSNFHALITLLALIDNHILNNKDKYCEFEDFEEYVKVRWGIKDFRGLKSRKFNSMKRKEYPQIDKIMEQVFQSLAQNES